MLLFFNSRDNINKEEVIDLYTWTSLVIAIHLWWRFNLSNYQSLYNHTYIFIWRRRPLNLSTAPLTWEYFRDVLLMVPRQFPSFPSHLFAFSPFFPNYHVRCHISPHINIWDNNTNSSWTLIQCVTWFLNF